MFSFFCLVVVVVGMALCLFVLMVTLCLCCVIAELFLVCLVSGVFLCCCGCCCWCHPFMCVGFSVCVCVFSFVVAEGV